MLHTKLLLWRLACVPWLLAAGLVLGWAREAAAQTSATISLTADPTVISEDAGATDVVVTATLDGLDGKVFDENVVLLLLFDNESTARRDADYTAGPSPLTIPAGSVSGTTTLTIIPYNDKRVGADKTIRLGAYNNQITAKDAEGNDVNVTVGTVDITLKDAGASSVLSFDGDAAIYDQTYIVGRAITDWLPEALGGIGNLTYSISALPAGLSFDASTRRLAGTPSSATDGAIAVTYRVTDESGATITRTFTITVVNGVGDTTVSLTVNPSVISEGAGPTNVIVTGTLDGKVFNEDVTVFLTFDNDENIDKAARRDVDYDARLSLLVIPAGLVSGKTTITVTAINDKRVEGEETIRLKGAYAKTVGNRDITLKDAGAGSTFSFAADAAIDAQTYTAGTAIESLVLPAASGGTGTLTYSVSGLPAGLSFDASTRRLSGTPSSATDGAVSVTYRVTDAGGAAITRTFTITIVEAVAAEPEEPEESEEPEEPGDSSLAFADDAAINAQTYIVGTAITALVLPEASGGTGNLTYRVLALPAGLSFDASTRRLSGTPSAATDGAVEVTYRVTDEDGATDRLTFTINIGEKPTPTVELDGIASSHDSVREDDGQATTITLTVTLDKAAATEEKVTLAIVSPTQGKTAKHDEDFDATLDETITIAKGQTKGTAQLTLTPKDNTTADGHKFFGVQATSSGGHQAQLDIRITDNEMDGEGDGEDDGEDDGELAFGFAEEVEDQAYTAGTAITPLVLPEASGGTGVLTYRLVGLPAGLAFDSATRTLSGTPSAATEGAVEVFYTVTDEAGAGAFLIFSITVNPALSFGDFFNFGSGKVVPTASHD